MGYVGFDICQECYYTLKTVVQSDVIKDLHQRRLDENPEAGNRNVIADVDLTRVRPEDPLMLSRLNIGGNSGLTRVRFRDWGQTR